MAVAICGVRELDRDERLTVRPVVARAVAEELVNELPADKDGQEIVDDQPLVVPAEGAAGFVE